MKRAEERTRPKLTIGLLWHSFQSDNFGVGALSQSQIAICDEAAAKAGVEIEFVVFGTQGGSRYGLDDGRIRLGSKISLKELITGRSPFFREVHECDVVLDIGEGDSFTDIYGLRRYFVFVLTKIAVLLKKKLLILSPQTIGPFDRWYTRWIAFEVMSRCYKIYARDSLSFAYLKKFEIRDNSDEIVDVAFRLPYIRPAHPDTGKVRIGINVSGLLFSGGYTGGNQFGLTLDYPAHVRQLLMVWSANSNYEVWLIPHVIPNDLPRDDDRTACAQLKSEFPHAQVAPEFSSPSEAKSFISGMDFVTGARMHACIAAFSSQVPVVPVAYSRKFNGLFSMLGYEWIADAKTLNTEQATQVVLDGFNNRAELIVKIRSGLEIAEAHLDKYVGQLADVLAQLTEAPIKNEVLVRDAKRALQP